MCHLDIIVGSDDERDLMTTTDSNRVNATAKRDLQTTEIVPVLASLYGFTASDKSQFLHPQGFL